jgi:hypothetical protein
MGDRTLVRERSLVSRTCSIVVALAGLAQGQATFGDEKATAANDPGDRLPYKIAAHVAIAPEARIDARGREQLLSAWRGLVHRFVGPPWDLSIAEGDRFVAGLDLAALEPGMLTEVSRDVDKVWLIQVGRVGPDLLLVGREFDTLTGRLGPTYRRPARIAADLPRALLNLSQDLFRPSATIGEESGGGVALTIRGGSLKASSPFGQIIKAGTVFRPIRIVTFPDGERQVLDILFTYLRVESIDGPVARCAIISGLGNPLTRSIVQKNTLVALGSEPGPHPTRLRFLTLPDKVPAAGYLLTARILPDGLAREVGTTDREGRIVLEPSLSESQGLLALRLLAGNVEPLAEFPLMPGESDQERTLRPLDPRSLAVALESQLDSLRDTVIDLVAVRARLEARLKARFDGEDWDGAEATLKEFAELPARETFVKELARLKDDAAQQQLRNKTAVLTKTAQAQLAEVDGLIARYLDDEAFRAFADALAKVRSDAAARAKAVPKAKP